MARRTALSQVGGNIRTAGNPEYAKTLSAAWKAAEMEPVDVRTHGFHVYPARMHWATAATLIRHLTRSGEQVLDPFCGSGTVLIEAMVCGRLAFGADLNPLALQLVEVCSNPRSPGTRRRFQKMAHDVAEISRLRVSERTAIQVRLPKEIVRLYEPHVLKELGGLLEEIQKVENTADRKALQIVFSSILTKCSKKAGETSHDIITKRLRKGLATDFFERKSHELVLRWEALDRDIPRGAPTPQLFQCDARRVHQAISTHVDAIITSPPYVGTYDYVSHHEHRLTWLGLNERPLLQGEIGARRHFGQTSSHTRWDRELGDVLAAFFQVLRPNGLVIFLLGDGEIAGKRVAADVHVRRISVRCGFRFIASASQERQDFRRKGARAEHLLMLVKTS